MDCKEELFRSLADRSRLSILQVLCDGAKTLSQIAAATRLPQPDAMAKSHHQWSRETGYINEEMMAKYLGAAKSPIYYIVGPPKMVSGLHRMINESGIDDDDIRTEDFSGY